MQCAEIRKRLNAWVDNELSRLEAERIHRHLKHCNLCRQEANGIQQIVASLDALPAFRAPAALSGKILYAFRTDFEKQGIGQWWEGLGLALRGVVFGAVLAGLIAGALLGTSISSPTPDRQTDPYQSLYASKGILP